MVGCICCCFGLFCVGFDLGVVGCVWVGFTLLVFADLELCFVFMVWVVVILLCVVFLVGCVV